MFLVETTVAGAVEFSAAAAAVTFAEELAIPSRDASARIVGYSYNSLGAAHTVRLWIATAAGVAVNLRTDLETPPGTVNSFTQACGSDGIIVPQVQASGATFLAFFETVGKADDGTLRLWYTIRAVD